MMIAKRALPRRAFLRGTGVVLGLPLLDAMTPLSAVVKGSPKPVPRLGFFYVGNGMALPSWRVASDGPGFEFSPILKALEPHRKHVTVVSGLSNFPAVGGGLGVHARPCGAYLTGVRPLASEAADFRAGVSADQIAARVLGKDTVFESLELATDPPRIGICEYQYSCFYTATISWRSPTVPNPMEVNPRVVFERLFGTDPTMDARARRLQLDKSILDAVTKEVAGFKSQIGSSDRAVLTEYLDSIRFVEQRIQKSEKRAILDPTLDRPIGVPEAFDEHVKVLSELLALAWQADLTRVATFIIARESSGRSYPEIGVAEEHHDLSHHQGRHENLSRLAAINTYHMTLFAHLVERLKNTPDGDGTLLDRALLLYGAGISDSDLHSPLDLPLVLVGGGCGTVKGDRHVKSPADQKVPMANLLRTILDRAGVPVETLGDSTGELAVL